MPDNRASDTPKFSLPDLVWVEIPSGTRSIRYLIRGTAQDNKPSRMTQYTVELAAFKISQSPVTNAQWQAFMDDPAGYRDKRWWSYAADALDHRMPVIYAPVTRGGDAPRTAVNYYAALAFCFWLSEKTGLSITLPTYAELEHTYSTQWAALTRDHSLHEWTITAYHDPQDPDMVRSRPRIVRQGVDERAAAALDTYAENVGFRLVVTDRCLESVVPPEDYANAGPDPVDFASAPELPQRLTAETLLSGFRWADVALGEGIHEHQRIEEVRAAPTGKPPIAALDFPVARPDPKPREDKVIITRAPDDIDAFRVAQQPVTNAQFAVFLQDPAGYANKTWWDYNPAARRSRPDIPPPPGTPGDDDPRTMVNWWMAVAFALWLSARLGEDIRLPTGEKWRRAVERRNRAVDGLREWGCYADSNSPIALFRWGKIRPAVYAVDAVNRRQDLTGAEMAGDLGFRMIHTGLPFDGLAGPGIG